MASIVANVGVLAVFKYYNFINDNISGLATYFLGHEASIFPVLKIALPIGLSFHTFQAMSYTFEVYKGRQKAEKHLGLYALYVMFYPQLVAGPIERPQNILPQFYQEKHFSYENLLEGSTLMAMGFFKKLVVADNLAVYVNRFYECLDAANSLAAILAAFFFSFQIYCDFSGYSDIARGAAKCMGYDLMINFNRPYLSDSLSRFWTRWHISLSTWFRDYVYIPLGGNRKGRFIQYKNLLIVFLLSGLWHGANWTYVIWGALHGCALILENTSQKIFSGDKSSLWGHKLGRFVKTLLVFGFVCLAWVFFRAENLAQAAQFFSILGQFRFSLYAPSVSFGLGYTQIALCLIVIVLLALVTAIPQKQIEKRPWLFLFCLIYLIFLLGRDGQNEFIYFQF